MKNDISLAQWALIEEHRSGKVKAMDIPRMVREDFGLNGIEWVNTLFEVPTLTYLDALKEQCKRYDVQNVLIMVDEEGDGCSSTEEGRDRFLIQHQKWVDIAQYLGCHAIRTNCRGNLKEDPDDSLKWATESYLKLLEYAGSKGIRILIENHGGFSDNADWMVRLFKSVDHPLFGSYPDWRDPSFGYDHIEYLSKMLPWAGGVSYRNQPTEEMTAQMIRICVDGGYTGWYGIESEGREEVLKGKALLKKYLE